jgi:hypothetical protein
MLVKTYRRVNPCARSQQNSSTLPHLWFVSIFQRVALSMRKAFEHPKFDGRHQQETSRLAADLVVEAWRGVVRVRVKRPAASQLSRDNFEDDPEIIVGRKMTIFLRKRTSPF